MFKLVNVFNDSTREFEPQHIQTDHITRIESNITAMFGALGRFNCRKVYLGVDWCYVDASQLDELLS